MNYLITGGNGFLGVHLANHLVRDGHNVTVYDWSDIRAKHLDDRVKYIVNLEYIENDAVFEGQDIVYHLAWYGYPGSNVDMEYDAHNINFSINTLYKCVRRKVKKVIFPSSGGTVYGMPQSMPISENHPTDPICSYGIAKLAVEKYLAVFSRLYDLDYTVLRFSNAYGYGQSPQRGQGLVAVLFDRIANGKEIEVWGDGSAVRDYIYVGDVVRAFVSAQISTYRKVFNIGTGIGTSVRELISMVEKIVGKQAIVKYSETRDCDVSTVVLDSMNFRVETDWVGHFFDLEVGLDVTWKHILLNEGIEA